MLRYLNLSNVELSSMLDIHMYVLFCPSLSPFFVFWFLSLWSASWGNVCVWVKQVMYYEGFSRHLTWDTT